MEPRPAHLADVSAMARLHIDHSDRVYRFANAAYVPRAARRRFEVAAKPKLPTLEVSCTVSFTADDLNACVPSRPRSATARAPSRFFPRRRRCGQHIQQASNPAVAGRAGTCPALATVVLDKRLLMFNALVSDEVLAATLVLATIITVLSFVAISLSVQSVLDAVQLLYAGSTWIQGVSGVPLRLSAI